MAGPRILITNGGLHPASKWADIIADDLIEIDPSTPDSPEKLAARKLRMDIVAAITPLIEDCQKAEREGRHDHKLNADPHVADIQKAINALIGKTSFKAHFKQEHVQGHMANRCGQHLRTAMHIENMHKEQ
jgi:hypothetical protein